MLNKPDMKERFISLGVEVIGGPPEQWATAMRAEVLRMGKVIRPPGIRDQQKNEAYAIKTMGTSLS